MLAGLTLLAGRAAPVARAADFPEPSSYPIAWQLDFTHGMPKRIVVAVPTSPIPQAYWYMTYQVTNNTDREEPFLPSFDLLADDGRVVKSNVDIPQSVFDAIKGHERNKYLEPITAIVGTVRIGPAEARDGVAIWPEPLKRMGHFSVFVTGLSGEADIMKMMDGKLQKVTDAGQMKDRKDLIIFRKTLQIDFFIRGDEVYPGEDEVNTSGEKWIMR